MRTNNYYKKQIKDLLPGDIVLHPVYRNDGLMLINKNKELSSQTIGIVKKHMSEASHVLTVSCNNEFDIFVKDKIYLSDEYKKSIYEIAQEHKVMSQDDTSSVKSYMPVKSDSFDPFSSKNDVKINRLFIDLFNKMPFWNQLQNSLESEALKNRALTIKRNFLQLLDSDETFFQWLTEIRTTNEDLTVHSINTTCIALLIGLTLELSDTDLLDLSIAALFSNIGLKHVPNEELSIFYKSRPLIKTHLEAFRNMTVYSPHLRKKSIIYGVLDGHEFYNGKGYPNGKKGNEISLFGRILHLSHYYDILLSGYFTNNIFHSFQAIKTIYENKEGRYDINLFKIFIYRTVYSKIGRLVNLPNGSKGTILGFSDYINSPHLPIVKLENGTVIDLHDPSI